jgi:outer membrane protein TolC
VPDERLLAIGVEGNPGLAALAAQVAGRTDAIQVARLQYLPDFSPAATFAGGAEQMVGTMVMLATRIPQIEASIREARAMAAAAEALLRQERLDRGATFVATLVALRDDERRIAILRDHVAPVVETAAASARSGYSTGGTMLTDWLAAERARIDVARLVAESRIAREKRLAALEALAGVDAETLDGAAPPVFALRAVGGPTP